MTRGELLRSGLVFLVSSVVFAAAYAGILLLAFARGSDPFAEPVTLYLAAILVFLTVPAALGGVYMLVRGAFRSSRYEPHPREEHVGPVIIES